MNQRINELINQATITCMGVDPAHAVPAPNLRFNMILAELIVQECASIVENAVTHREPASTYVDKIKQHFGVEE